MDWAISPALDVEKCRNGDFAVAGKIEPAPMMIFANLGHPRRNVGRGENSCPDALGGFFLELPLDCHIRKLGRPRLTMAIDPEFDCRAMRAFPRRQHVKCSV